MSNKKEIVDLVPCEGGTYGVKGTKTNQKQKKKLRISEKVCNKDNMEQLFFGMDVGLEFMEGILGRVKKIQNLKKLL
jgi:hypothetical protein